MKRCSWVPKGNHQYEAYHDLEWGKPLTDDRALFELLCLETYQAGLSWATVLKKRQAFCQVFHNYEIASVGQMGAQDLANALENPQIIRHKQKLQATITNAKAVRIIQQERGSFANYLWEFVGGEVIMNRVDAQHPVPAQTQLSQQLAKDLKKRGFAFVGPTTVYAFLEAAGFVNDHEVDCDFR
ncbi:MAG: 3-methyladenine DNA glycosylase [Streptococcus pyogenes]|uniref:DNA-3-methyladenine glycosylase I n=1 Tax=Streptococcus halichoeri TaxID=254785 RepID=UPI000DB65FB6|nr:DNA-3-methyladenine glycosylase I [Streptococcus halichoeri]PZO94501.1 MAG: 3-methyladenine DNA glycosylase [Streptococcus pyogenes]